MRFFLPRAVARFVDLRDASNSPMAQSSELANLGEIPSYSDDVPPPSSGAPRRGEILLIEDCTEVREGLAQLLELHGYMVTEFADGERGMRELTTQPQAFALVILDLMLGESMAGMDFRLQQLLDSQLASVPTIVITAHDDMGLRERCEAVGAAAFLVKPVDGATLIDAINIASRPCSR